MWHLIRSNDTQHHTFISQLSESVQNRLYIVQIEENVYAKHKSSIFE